MLAGLLATNTATALSIGDNKALNKPTELIQTNSAAATQLQIGVISQTEAQIRDPNETESERRLRERQEKVDHIFTKILDGVEEKREEALQWLIEFGDEIIDRVHDKADYLIGNLQTFADNKVAELQKIQNAYYNALGDGVADGQEEIYRAKQAAAEAIIAKREDVMYKIKDLKIELSTAFDHTEKAEKSAKIESLVSALESWIN